MARLLNSSRRIYSLDAAGEISAVPTRSAALAVPVGEPANRTEIESKMEALTQEAFTAQSLAFLEALASALEGFDAVVERARNAAPESPANDLLAMQNMIRVLSSYWHGVCYLPQQAHM